MANYSSVNLACVTKSSGIILFNFTDTGNNWQAVTSVNSNPSIYITNGSYNWTIVPTGAVWSNTAAFVMYNMASSIPVTATVTYSATSGWVTTSIGNLNASTGVVANYGGKGQFYTAFNNPTSLQVGLNSLSPENQWYDYYPMKNFRYMLAGSATSKDNTGYPTGVYLKGDYFTTSQTAFTNIFGATQYLTLPTGIYKVIYDDNPACRSTLFPSLAALPGVVGPTLITSGSYSPALGLVTGVEWDVQINPSVLTPLYSGGGGSAASVSVFQDLYINISAVSGTPKFSNLWVIPPNNNTDRSNPAAVDQNFINYLSNDNSALQGCRHFRTMNSMFYGNANPLVFPSDLPTTGNFTTLPCGSAISIPVLAIQGYNYLTGSGLFSEIYQTWGRPTRPPVGFYGNGPWFQMEVISSGNHNFHTGQWVSVNNMPFVPVQYGNAVAYTGGFTGGGMPCYVTSPSSILTFGYLNNATGTLNGTSYCNVSGYTIGNANTTLSTIQYAGTIPYEYQAAQAGAVSGCGLWINVGAAYTDATVAKMAQAIYNNIPSDRNIYVEYTNEHWNSGYVQQQSNSIMSNALYSGSLPYYHVKRSIEVWNIFKSVFASGNFNRSNQIKRTLMSWYTQNYWDALLLTALSGFNQTCDYFGNAPYWNMPNDASIINAYNSNLWSLAQFNEISQACVSYYPAMQGWLTATTSGIKAFNIATSSNIQHFTYEGTIQVVAAQGINNAAQTWHDQFYHPEYKTTKKAYMLTLQNYGVQGYTQFGFAGAWTQGNSNWPSIIWYGQQWGNGDGSDGKAVNQFTTASPTNSSGIFDQVNVSTDFQALKDFWTASPPISGIMGFYQTPVITGSYPLQSAFNILPNSNLSVSFSQPMNTGALSFILQYANSNNSVGGSYRSSVFNASAFNTVAFNSAFIGSSNPGVTFSQTYNSGTNTFTLTPSKQLNENTLYTLQVSGITSAQGATNSPTGISFTTLPPPTVSGIFPANNGLADVSFNPYVGFYNPIATGLQFSITHNSINVPGNYYVSGNAAYFIQTYPFNFSTTYNANLSYVSDNYGGFSSPITWSFTTLSTHGASGVSNINPFTLTLSASDLRSYTGIQIIFQ